MHLHLDRYRAPHLAPYICHRRGLSIDFLATYLLDSQQKLIPSSVLCKIPKEISESFATLLLLVAEIQFSRI
jgi:hypothetical protein